MAKRKSRALAVRRRMPPHIVLPNGMWRFVKRGTRAKAKSPRRSSTKRKRSGFVARRRYYARPRRRTSRRSSGGKLMTGLFKPKGLLAGLLIGAGAAVVVGKVAPQVIPYQDIATGFVVGGLPGAAGAYALRMFAGGGIGNGGGIRYF